MFIAKVRLHEVFSANLVKTYFCHVPVFGTEVQDTDSRQTCCAAWIMRDMFRSTLCVGSKALGVWTASDFMITW
jgi:hypothetical protein